MWTSFAFAMRLATSMPALGPPPERDDARRALVVLPIVGIILGMVTGSVWVLAERLWAGEWLVAAAFALAAQLWVTGGRGFGAVGRTADALSSYQEDGDRTRSLALLRDSRRGSVGIAAVAIGVLLKGALLAALRPDLAWAGLIVAGCVGQWTFAFVAILFGSLEIAERAAAPADPYPNPHERMDEASRVDIPPHLTARSSMEDFFGAMVASVLGCAFIPVRGLAALTGASIIAGTAARSIDERFNGVPLQFAYALAEIAEIAALGVVTMHL
ncbi:MAG: adenosylcobinamide-GDP ribazoletransferase [Capsulimonadaceae bacterium]